MEGKWWLLSLGRQSIVPLCPLWTGTVKGDCATVCLKSLWPGACATRKKNSLWTLSAPCQCKCTDCCSNNTLPCHQLGQLFPHLVLLILQTSLPLRLAPIPTHQNAMNLVWREKIAVFHQGAVVWNKWSEWMAKWCLRRTPPKSRHKWLASKSLLLRVSQNIWIASHVNPSIKAHWDVAYVSTIKEDQAETADLKTACTTVACWSSLFGHTSAWSTLAQVTIWQRPTNFKPTCLHWKS